MDVPASTPSAGPVRRDPRRAPERRSDELLAVSRTLLRRGGLAGLSMAAIAEEAGCSRPAVYQYFQSKEEVVMALAIDSAGVRNLLYARVRDFDARPRERLVALAEVDAILYPEVPVLEETTYANALRAGTSTARQDELRRAQRVAYESYVACVRAAVESGDLTLPRHVDAEQLIFTLATFSTGLFAPVSRGLPDGEDDHGDPRPAMRRLGSAFLDGLGWKPLTTEWDYRRTLRRVYADVFPADYLGELGLPSSSSINQARGPRRRAATGR
jgi:AcrR family transcriptional regulator